MNLFSDIEGKQGEALTSAVLGHLLLRSSVIREAFIKIISERSPQGPVSIERRFACTREEATENKDGKRGFLDLLLETDDAVIGIENKLFAGWQSDQPVKYLDSLQAKGKKLQEITGREVRHLLAVLIPSFRVKEVNEKVFGNDRCVVITWQDVLSAMGEQSSNLDPSSASILLSLNEFVLDIVGFMPKFQDWSPHFRRSWVPKGNLYQRQLAASIWRFFPDPGPRLGAGKAGAGYYFAINLEANHAWYGFVPRSNLRLRDAKDRALPERQDRQAELVIATTFPVNFLPQHFVPIAGEGILASSKEVLGWIVEFDNQWETPEKWISELKPLFDQVSKLKMKTSDVGQ